MLRRFRNPVRRAPQALLWLAFLAFVAPALAGPLAFCLNSGDGPRVVAAAKHCEAMAKSSGGMHLPAVDEAVGSGAGPVGVPSVPQAPLLFVQVGGLLPPPPDPLPSRDDAYGGAAPDGSPSRSLAGAVAGRSARLLI